MHVIKKKHINKRFLLLLFLLIILLIIFVCLHPRNYEINYEKDNVKITEKYNKSDKTYTFIFNYEDKNYFFETESKYLKSKKLINNIIISSDDTTTCLTPESEKLSTYPLCYENDTLISYHAIDNKDLIDSKYLKEINPNSTTYNNIEINYLNNKKYYLYNYKGFYIIDNNNNKELQLFDSDAYNITLATTTSNYLVIADYNSKYNFNKLYVINSKNNKVKEITTKEDISFDSYFLGTYKNKVYLMDKKNKKEYEINAKKLTINNITSKNKGKVLINNEWQDISINKLANDTTTFEYENVYNYILEDNKLYLESDNIKTLITKQNVKDIVKIDDETIYYLVDDKLYYFNNSDGEVFVMSYFEWNFNYKNMIYIF
jgi:hypothetical protein